MKSDGGQIGTGRINIFGKLDSFLNCKSTYKFRMSGGVELCLQDIVCASMHVLSDSKNSHALIRQTTHFVHLRVFFFLCKLDAIEEEMAEQRGALARGY